MRELCMIALVLAACGHKKSGNETAGSATPGSAAAGSASAAGSATGSAVAGGGSAAGGDCADRAARLDKRLHELAAATPGFMPMLRDIHAPESSAGKPFDERGVVIAVAKDGGLFVQGVKLAGVDEAKQYLGSLENSSLEKHVMAGGSTRDAHFPLYIWADAGAPAAPIADVLAAAAPKDSHWTPRLLVAGKTPVPVGAEPSSEVKGIAAKVPASEPDATKYLVDQLKSAMGDCSAIITPFATASIEGSVANQTKKLLSDLPAGLTKCDCKIPNPDVLAWGMAEWFGASAPALAWVDMPALKKGNKQTIGKLIK